LITEPIVLSKNHLEIARILLHVASSMTDQMTADLLRGIADDCVERAVKRSRANKALAALTTRRERLGKQRK
jgi:hypothetical protein